MLGIMVVASTRRRHEGQNIKPNLHLVVALSCCTYVVAPMLSLQINEIT